MTKGTIIGLALAAAGVCLSSISIIARRTPAPAPGEFLCSADDEWTERHVGVISATPEKSGLWVLRYDDAPENFYYLQQPGETCYATR